MAEKPTQDGKPGVLTTPLGKDVLLLERFDAVEALSELFEFRIDALSTEADLDFDGAIGQQCSVKIKTYKDEEREFHGILAEAQWIGVAEHFYSYQIVLRPWLWLLSHTTDYRIFENKKAPDIIEEVFRDRGFTDFKSEIRDRGSFPTLEYCVQYRETDFHFVSRLMEKEGIYYFFKHEGGKHTLVLANMKSSHQPVPRHETISFLPPVGRFHPEEQRPEHWGAQRRFRTGKFALNDHNYEKPNTQMLSEASASATMRLDSDFRRKMEDAFGEGFGDVAIEQSARAATVTAALRTIAAACDNSIYLSPDFFAYQPEFRERVLAHELAHIVQKRRFDPTTARPAFDGADRASIEAEAHCAADRAVCGRAASVALVDAPNIAVPWGPAGHYYTSYFVMLAAGVEAERAQHRAFFCQMPDQVHEFDAISATLDMLDYYNLGIPAWGIATYLGTKKLTPPSRGVQGFAGTPNPDLHWETRVMERFNARTGDVIEIDVSSYVYATPARRLEIDKEVTEGLHALTGGWATTETEFRGQILKDAKDDDLAFGLALHPYGDSFAHRQIHNPKVMYDASHGGHAGDGHDPDNLGERLGEGGLYLKYVESLYNVCKGATPRLSLKRTIDVLGILKSVKEDIKTLDPEGNDKLACQLLRTLASNTHGMSSLQGYRPEDEDPIYWCQFWQNHKDIINPFGGADAVFTRVRKYGQDWFRKRLQYVGKNEIKEKRAVAAEEARKAEEWTKKERARMLREPKW